MSFPCPPPPLRSDIIRRDIRRYIVKCRQEKESARCTAHKLLSLDAQSSVQNHVQFTCSNINKLLLELDTLLVGPQQKMVERSSSPGGGSTLFAQEISSSQAISLQDDEMRLFRKSAADDTTVETASVADYGADPPCAVSSCPRASFFVDCAQGIYESTVKCKECVHIIKRMVSEHAQWWSTPHVLRRIKSYSIRCNYHSRRIRKWNSQMRSAIFVSISLLNRDTRSATVELGVLRRNEEQVSQRSQRLQTKKSHIEASLLHVQPLLVTATEDCKKVEERLLLRASKQVCPAAKGTPSSSSSGCKMDPSLAETLLLLWLLQGVPHLQSSVDEVTSWMLNNCATVL